MCLKNYCRKISSVKSWVDNKKCVYEQRLKRISFQISLFAQTGFMNTSSGYGSPWGAWGLDTLCPLQDWCIWHLHHQGQRPQFTRFCHMSSEMGVPGLGPHIVARNFAFSNERSAQWPNSQHLVGRQDPESATCRMYRASRMLAPSLAAELPRLGRKSVLLQFVTWLSTCVCCLPLFRRLGQSPF